ncbi:hypothetical protein [Mesobacillus maritimus]|uniref:hypothetical protein n=1 Tax=Mesobacillus maritimus TaxID=1643336 RepID=UPI00384AA52F
MNRLFLLLNTLFLIVVLSACGEATGTPIEPNENNTIITIKNKAEFEFDGIELALLNHTQGGVNADGSIIEKDEVLRFEFLTEDFELDGDVEMEVYILTDNGDRALLNKKALLELRPNQEIFFELTGGSVNEAVLKRVK